MFAELAHEFFERWNGFDSGANEKRILAAQVMAFQNFFKTTQKGQHGLVFFGRDFHPDEDTDGASGAIGGAFGLAAAPNWLKRPFARGC